MFADLGSHLKPFSVQGRWWLPDRSSNPIGGTLIFDGERHLLTLELVGVLDPAQMPTWFTRYPVVFGHTADGKDLTLCNCARLERRPSAGTIDLGREVVSAGLLFIGAALPDGTATVFDHVTYEFDNLLTWSAVEPLVTSGMQEGTHVVRTAIPEFDVLSLPVGTLTLARVMSEEHTMKTFAITRAVSLSVELFRPMTDAEVFDKVTRPLQHFLTLACDAPCHLIRLKYGLSTHKIALSPEVSMFNPITAIHSGDVPHVDLAEPYDVYMLFTLSDVQAQFEALIE